MQLFEIIRWGNESDDPMTGGPDGPDTCFLVRAESVEAAAALVDRVLSGMASRHVQPWSHSAYLLGAAEGKKQDARVLRGPYVQHGHNHGWRQWLRNDPDEPWHER